MARTHIFLLLVFIFYSPQVMGEVPVEEPEVFWGEMPVDSLSALTASDSRCSTFSPASGFEGEADVSGIARFIQAAYSDEAGSRKEFACNLLPVIETINRKILEDRKRVQELLGKLSRGLSREESKSLWLILMRYRLLGSGNFYYSMTQYNSSEIERKLEREAEKLANAGKVPGQCEYNRRNAENALIAAKAPLESPACQEEILKRVDSIPAGLVLAQAAVESGWGGSRFAREGKNLFGIQYKFATEEETASRKNCIPAEKDKRRCVYRFDSYSDSLYEYFRFLNAGTYQDQFREHRYGEDKRGPVRECGDAARYAGGLKSYAEKPNYASEIAEQVYVLCALTKDCAREI